jgi:hypothetical protein
MKGIRRDQYGLRAYVKVGGVQREKRFPADTPISRIKAWRDDARVQLRKRPVRNTRGTLAADVDAYFELETVRTLVSVTSLRCELAAWVELYGDRPRTILTRLHILDARERWLKDGYAPKTINHRVRALRGLFHRLDGSKAETPCDDVTKLEEPPANPKFVEPRRILRVAKKLAPWPFEQGVFLVLTSTGQRPAQLKRTRMDDEERDVDLRRRVWSVRPAGSGQLSDAKYLTSG